MGSSLTPTPVRGHLNSLERRGAKAQPPDEDVSGRKRPLHRERESPLRCIPRSGLFHVWKPCFRRRYTPCRSARRMPGSRSISDVEVSGYGARRPSPEFLIWIPAFAGMSGVRRVQKKPEHFCPSLFRSRMNRILPDADPVGRGEVVFRSRLDVEGLVPGVGVAQRTDDAELGRRVRIGGDLLLLRLLPHLRLPDL